MKNPWVIIGVIAVVLFGGAMWLSSMSVEKNNEGIELIEHVAGNPEAEVVLAEYSDFQCPACAAFQPVVDELLATYGDSVRFEYRHFPLPIHNFALNAAVAAEAAGQQGKFFEYGKMLFDNQAAWSNAGVPTGLFISYAEELGLDVEMFSRHMKSTILRDKVKADLNEARQQGLTGTPTFYLNGERMVINTYQDFIEQVVLAIDPSAAVSSSTEATTSDVRFGI